MPDHFHKLCMLIPVRRFDGVLHDPTGYEGLHLSSDRPLAALLGSYLTTLCDEVAMGQDSASAGTVDVTLELLAAAFRAVRSRTDDTPRKHLQHRIIQYVESRLADSTLTPASIAEAHGISLRYLYLLISEQQMTVAELIRVRRLARCRSALDNYRDVQTVAEIAYKWGFSDSAHFSRLFKNAYGISPSAYKASRQQN